MVDGFDPGTISENFADFGKEFVHTAVANPWNALVQIADNIPGVNLPEIQSQGANNKESIGAKAGAVGGFIVDFAILSFATKGFAKPLLKRAGMRPGPWNRQPRWV